MLFITAALNMFIGLSQFRIDWGSFVPTKRALTGCWPTGIKWSRYVPEFRSLRGWISRRRDEKEQPYLSVESEEMSVIGEDKHASDSESDIGQEQKVEDRV